MILILVVFKLERSRRPSREITGLVPRTVLEFILLLVVLLLILEWTLL
jgi:hypothetical protein